MLGSASSISVPQYLEVASGTGNASATDQTTFGPITRLGGSVSQATINTTNDTFRCSATYNADTSIAITNIGLFSSNSNPPVGSIASQVNLNSTMINILGYNNFPNNSWPFNIQIGSEVMTVISGNGTNTWNVIRAVNGSTLTLNPIPIGTEVVGASGTSNGNMYVKSSFAPIYLDAGSSVEFVVNLQFV